MTIGGYAFWVDDKKIILATEGVYFDNKNKLTDLKNLFYFS